MPKDNVRIYAKTVETGRSKHRWKCSECPLFYLIGVCGGKKKGKFVIPDWCPLPVYDP